MSEYIFGVGPGHLSDTVDAAARELGACLVNHTEPGCECGHGCRDSCPQRRRHWFTVPNLGNGAQVAERIMAELRAAGHLPQPAEPKPGKRYGWGGMG